MCSLLLIIYKYEACCAKSYINDVYLVCKPFKFENKSPYKIHILYVVPNFNYALGRWDTIYFNYGFPVFISLISIARINHLRIVMFYTGLSEEGIRQVVKMNEAFRLKSKFKRITLCRT